ncbi:tetratricopeptide repeat protein [Catellatospora sp. NEAU-YM18]|nr:tetratricopeptide repeat protein [Catellatospora tritici]
MTWMKHNRSMLLWLLAMALATVGLFVFLHDYGPADTLLDWVGLFLGLAGFVTSTVNVKLAQAGRPVPRQLLADIKMLVGRDGELKQLTRILLRRRRGQSGGPAVAVVTGAAGVGKTALAVRCGHRLANRFPDGQLYLDMQGFGDKPPLATAQAAVLLLHSLRVPAPDDETELLNEYRTAIADRRLFLLLDNVRDEAQVRPLLPTNAASAIILTSRNALQGLVFNSDAEAVPLKGLNEESAGKLLRRIIGERAVRHPDQARALAAECDWLPMALRIAAEVAAARPHASLAELAGRLRDELLRPDTAGTVATERSVAAAFHWSYAELPETAATLFRRLSLHPGADFDEYTAAALLDTDVTQARKALSVLSGAHLVEYARGDSFRLYSLLRDYADGLQAAAETPQQRRAAESRLIDLYLATTAACMDWLYPAEPHAAGATAGQRALPPIANADAARRWLEDQRANRFAIVVMAAKGKHPQAGAFASTLWRYFVFPAAAAGSPTSAGFSEGEQLNRQMLAIARQDDDRLGQANALMDLGLALLQQGRHPEAVETLTEAVAAYGDSQHFALQSRARSNLGAVLEGMGRYREALECFTAAHESADPKGDQVDYGMVLDNLGVAYRWLGDQAAATSYARQALAVLAAQADHAWTAIALTNFGETCLHFGDLVEAERLLRASVAMFGQVDDPTSEAVALSALGYTLARRGNRREGMAMLRGALDRQREQKDDVGVVVARYRIGVLLGGSGRLFGAVRQLRQALALAREHSMGGFETRILNALGSVYQRLHLRGRAAGCYRAAAALAAAGGDPHELKRAAEGVANAARAAV